jgi:hypothetical protein
MHLTVIAAFAAPILALHLRRMKHLAPENNRSLISICLDRHSRSPHHRARLQRAGTYGKQILAGWKAKEKPRALRALARTPAARSLLSHRLHEFMAWCAGHAHLPELATMRASRTPGRRAALREELLRRKAHCRSTGMRWSGTRHAQAGRQAGQQFRVSARLAVEVETEAVQEIVIDNRQTALRWRGW